MLKKVSRATLLLLVTVSTAFADVDVVIDDFEGYSNDSELQTSWPSSNGSITSSFLGLTTDTNYTNSYPNFDGQAAIFDGSIGEGANTVNNWAGIFNATPSATQNVEITVDLAHDGLSSNKKLTLGLRGPAGIIELGFFNQAPLAIGHNFAYRNVLFSSGDTNWQEFSLDQRLDTITEVHTPIEAGAFHRFKAVISETDVTFTLDLYADGLINAAVEADFDDDEDIDGADFFIWQRGFLTGTNSSSGDANGDDVVDATDLGIWTAQFGGPPPALLPGVDAIDVVPAVVRAGGFDDLRFGIPSAAGSSVDRFLGVDNVELRLVDIPSVTIPSVTATTSAVPEPTAALLILLATAGMILGSRRRL